MDKPKTEPKTGRERQAALRQRRAAEGLTEVRGLYAPTETHDTIKRSATNWLNTGQWGEEKPEKKRTRKVK